MKKISFIFNVDFKEKYVLIYFLDEVLLKQYYFKNKSKVYCLFYIYAYLYKLGLLNKKFKANVYI